MADDIREGRYESYRTALSGDHRPLCVEHLGDRDVLRWLRGWVELLPLD